MDNNTKRDNWLIATFMGSNKSEFGDYLIFTIDNPQYVGKINHDEIKYHLSWDWLMPVVAKIETLGYNVDIDWCFIHIKITSSSKKFYEYAKPHMIDDKLNILYIAIVEFVRWYNKNNGDV